MRSQNEHREELLQNPTQTFIDGGTWPNQNWKMISEISVAHGFTDGDLEAILILIHKLDYNKGFPKNTKESRKVEKANLGGWMPSRQMSDSTSQTR